MSLGGTVSTVGGVYPSFSLVRKGWNDLLPLHPSQGEWALWVSVQASPHLATVEEQHLIRTAKAYCVLGFKWIWVHLSHTVRVSSRRGGGSTQLISLNSTSIMADVSICFRTKERKPSFRRRKVSTWTHQNEGERQHKPWEAAPNFHQCLIKMVHKCELWFVIFQTCFWASRIQRIIPALSSLLWGFQWFCWKRTPVMGWVGMAAPRRHTDFPTAAPRCPAFHWSLPHRMSVTHMLYLNTCNE